ncbi:hypothetical protein BS78_04G231400 [Paspalum vaginatum]|nr:hypothetical protein BS78_04G231400 [Paspalum vaginatum]
MSDSGRCPVASVYAMDGSPATAAVGEKGKKRYVSNLEAAAEGGGDGVAVEEASVAGKNKWRVPQDLINYILSWDVSDYIFAMPDNMDYLPVSEEWKANYRARRKQAVDVMQQSCRTRRKIQEWVKAEVEKHGYIEIETTAGMHEKHQLEEYIIGQIA